MDPSTITDGIIREWTHELETWLPAKINGVCSPYEDTLTRYKYVPHSIRVENIEATNDDFPTETKIDLVITYQVERSDLSEGEFRVDHLQGAIAIPVEENRQLRLADIHPLDGVLDLIEAV